MISKPSVQVPQRQRSRDRRRFARFACTTEAACRPTCLIEAELVPTRVRDVSRGGVGLIVDQAFRLGSYLEVELPHPDGHPAATLLARVLHVAERNSETCTVGCAFAGELTDADLLSFGIRIGAAQVVDRRSANRVEPTWTTLAWYQPLKGAAGSPAPAAVLDLSTQGVGLICGRPLRVGKVVRMELRPGSGRATVHTLACATRLTPRSDGLWALGCNFIRELTLSEMGTLAGVAQCRPRRRPKRVLDKPFSLPDCPVVPVEPRRAQMLQWLRQLSGPFPGGVS